MRGHSVADVDSGKTMDPLMAFGGDDKQYFGTGPNVLGWGMAAAFVLQGVLNEELFLQPAFSGEMFLIFAKVYPFLKELREKMNDPNVLSSIEKVITRTKAGRDRLQFMIKRVETMRQKRAQMK